VRRPAEISAGLRVRERAVVIAHIFGIPVEEDLQTVLPLISATCAALLYRASTWKQRRRQRHQREDHQ
jgi:hypothetical protein